MQITASLLGDKSVIESAGDRRFSSVNVRAIVAPALPVGAREP
jgi:hypothetical protein